MIDYMMIADFLEDHCGEWCDLCGDEESAQEQIDSLREIANKLEPVKTGGRMSVEQITQETLEYNPSSATKIIPANCDEHGSTDEDAFKIADFCNKDSEGNLYARANLSGVNFTLKEFLEKIYNDVGDRIDNACPVCGGIAHSPTCWYPQLLIQLDKNLNEYDALYLRKYCMKEQGDDN